MAQFKRSTYTPPEKQKTLKRTNATNTGNPLAYIGKKIGIGAFGVLEGIGKTFEGTAALLSGNENYAKYVFETSKAGEWRQDLDEQFNPDAFMATLGAAGEGIGQSTTFLLNAAAPMLGTGMFFSGVVGNSVGNAVAQTGDLGFKEYGYGLSVGAAEAMLESLVGAGGQAVKTIATKGATTVTKSLGKAVVGRATRNAIWKNILKESAGEFAEEFLGDFVDVSMQKLWNINQNAEFSISNALYSGLVGAISGAAMGGTVELTNAATYTAAGNRVIRNGNVGTLMAQANAVANAYATARGGNKHTRMNQLIASIQASTDAYNALTEEGKQGARGALFLGEIQGGIFALQATGGVQLAEAQILEKAEKFADYASKESGKVYTVEDLRADKDGVLSMLAVRKFAGEFMRASEAEQMENGIRELIRRESAGEAADRMAFEEMEFSPEDAMDAASRVVHTDGVSMISESGAWDGESVAYKIPGGEFVFVFDNGNGTFNVGVGAEADFTGGKIRIANLSHAEVKEYLARVEENRILAERSEGTGTAEETEEDALMEGEPEAAEMEDGEETEEVGEESQTSEETVDEDGKRYSLAKENQDLSSLIRKVKSGEFKVNEKVVFGEVSAEIAGRIKDITGIDVTGYSVAIEARQIEHILKRHGENGTADHSLANDSDIAKMEYVLENPDDIRSAGRTTAYVSNKNGRNTTSETVLYEKNVGDQSYYVVQAVPNTSSKTLYIVSAFIGESGYKKEVPQSLNAQGLDATSENESANTSTDSIPQTDGVVKWENANNGGKHSLRKSKKVETEEKSEEARARQKEVADLASIQDRARKMVAAYDLQSAEVRYAIEEMYRSADETGADPSAADTAAHLIAVLGDVQIRFSNQITKNGLIDRLPSGERVILLNTKSDAQGGAVTTLLHEVTHYMEGSESYEQLKKVALESYPAEKAEEIKWRYRDYAEKNGKAFSDEYIEQEVAAEAVGELLVKGKYIARMRNRSTAWNAVTYLGRIAQGLAGKNRDAHAAARRLWVAFTKCLARTKGEAAEELRRYAVDISRDKDSKPAFTEEFETETANGFGIQKINDYIHVQRQVLATLNAEGFFENAETRSRSDVNRDSGMVIETNKSSIEETFNETNYKRQGRFIKVAKLATIRRISEIIANGVLEEDNVADTHQNAKNKKFAYIVYQTEVEGIPITVKLAIKKSSVKNKLWVHSIYAEKISAVMGEETDNRKATPVQTADIDNSIPQSDGVVKGEEKKYSLPKNETAEERAEKAEKEAEKAKDKAEWEKTQREFFEHHYKTAWDVRDYSDGLYRDYNGKWSKNKIRTLTLKIAGEIDYLTMYPQRKNAKQAQSNLERNLNMLTEELAFHQKSRAKAKEGEYIDYPKIEEELRSKIRTDLSEIMKNKLQSLDRAYNRVVYEFGEKIGLMRLEPYSVHKIWQEADRLLKEWGVAHNATKRYKGGHQAKAHREFLFRLNETRADWDLKTISNSLAADLIEHMLFKTEYKMHTAEQLDAEGIDALREQLADVILIQTQAEINEFEVDRAREAERVLKGEAELVDRLRKADKFLSGKTKPAGKPDADLQELRPVFEAFTKTVERGRITQKRAKKFAEFFIRWTKPDVENPTISRVTEMTQTTGTYEIIEGIALLDDSRDGDLTLEMVKGLNALYFELSKIYQVGNKVLIDGEWTDSLEIAQKGVTEGKGSPLHLNRRTTLKEKLTRPVMEFLLQSQDPLRTAMMLEGYAEGGVLSKLIYDVIMGEALRTSMQMEFMKPMEDFFKSHKGYQQKLAAKMIETATFGEITLGEAMSLIGLSRREQAKAGLANSDIFFASDEEGVRRVEGGWKRWASMNAEQRISMLTGGISELTKKLEAEDLEFFELVENFFNKVSTETKKKADRDYFGHEMTMEEYYFPIYRDRATIAEEVADAAKRMQNFITVSNQSFNKQVMKNAEKSLFVANVYDVVANHAAGLATYATLYRPVLNFNTIWNQQTSGNKNSPESMRSYYKQYVWEGIDAYMRNLFDAVQGITAPKGPLSKVFSTVRGNAVFFQLGLNPKTWLTQWTSIIASMDVLSAASVQYGIGAGRKANDELMDKYSIFARTRDYNMEVVKAEGAGDKIHKVGELSMAPISKMDRMVVRKLWAACQKEVETREGFAIGSEENSVAAGKLLDEVILRTQQTAGMATKSGLMRGGELEKSLTMFSSDAMKQLSSFTERVMRYRKYKADVKKGVPGAEEKLSEAKRSLAKTGASVMGVALAGAIIAQTFKLLYDRDRRKKPNGEEMNVVEDTALDSLGNLAGLLPIIRDVYDMIDSGYEVSDFTLDAFNTMIEAYITAGDDIKRAVAGEYVTQEEIASDARGLIYSVGMMLGIPTRNFNNLLEGTLNVSYDQAHWGYTALFKKPSYEKDLQEAIEKGDAALAELILATWLKREKVGAVGDELDVLMELYTKGYDILPSSAPSDLSAKQRKEWMAQMEVAQSQAAEMVLSSTWQSFTEEAKAEAIKKLYRNYKASLDTSLRGKEQTKGALLSDWYGYIPVAEISGMAAATETYEDQTGNEITKREQVEKVLALYDGEEALLRYMAGYTSQEAKRILAERVLEIANTEEERNSLYKLLGIDPEEL